MLYCLCNRIYVCTHARGLDLAYSVTMLLQELIEIYALEQEAVLHLEVLPKLGAWIPGPSATRVGTERKMPRNPTKSELRQQVEDLKKKLGEAEE